jgi:hypothetical protein
MWKPAGTTTQAQQENKSQNAKENVRLIVKTVKEAERLKPAKSF